MVHSTAPTIPKSRVLSSIAQFGRNLDDFGPAASSTKNVRFWLNFFLRLGTSLWRSQNFYNRIEQRFGLFMVFSFYGNVQHFGFLNSRKPFTFYKGILVIHMFYIFSESDTYMHIRICLGQFLKTNFSLHFLNIFEFLAKIALRELFYRFCAWKRKEASFQQHWNDWKVGWAQNANQILQIRTLNFEEETLLLMKNTNDYFNLWRSQKR